MEQTATVTAPGADRSPATPSLVTIAREWGRIGCIGFGGPPAHIALLRKLCVTDRRWISASEFEDGIAATNLLPGPASTQLSIFCAWRLRGSVGAVVGGLCFIVPGLVIILALAALFLSGHPPLPVKGAAAGAGAAVAAVAAQAAWGLVPASWKRAHRPGQHARWLFYAAGGAVASIVLGPFVVLVLLGAGVVEVAARGAVKPDKGLRSMPFALAAAPAAGGLLALAWTAFKVGALSYGGGFVIIPLMHSDAVGHYHWMTDAQFLNAVALGQVTPGPVVQTVAVVGYAAAGVGGGLLAAAIAFGPSFLFVLIGGPRFDRLRANPAVQAFLDGAGPAAIGAIAGSAVVLAAEIAHPWQVILLVAAAIWLLVLRRGVVAALVAAGAVGAIGALAGLPLS
jgi:chromate transporter